MPFIANSGPQEVCEFCAAWREVGHLGSCAVEFDNTELVTQTFL